MGRKKKKVKKFILKKKTEKKMNVKDETLRSIWALILISITAILVLAGFNYAGSVGNDIFLALFWLFGFGYVFLPIALLGVAINFFVNKSQKKIYRITVIGTFIFLVGSLGLIDVFDNKSGGILGTIFGYSKYWFGNVAWGIISFIFIIIGIILVSDQPIYIKKRKTGEKIKEFKRKKPIIPPFPKMEDDLVVEEKNIDIFNSDKKYKEEKKITKKSSVEGFKVMDERYQQDNEYSSPPINLLKINSDKPSAGDLRVNANIIKRTLESFGVPVEMGEISIGPKVTRYTLRPAEGIKLARIIALNQDLSLALAAHPIRIEAPIPGKPYVGIEVPNKIASLVRLGSLMMYPEFKESSSLIIPLGKDVTGKPIFADIGKMPHLLIAGATGSGKSITLHSILISLLYKNSPTHLNLVLIDPKRVELSNYSGLPHLIAPVVTSGKKALGVFKWAIDEMEKRYDKLLEAGTRDIQSYNKKNGDSMPYLIIVVDEMADLMAAYGHDIENAIVRLAQMARATGIHLILSTQRPSVEVITGLIKANITARIALQVASQVDSRTILDVSGAEKLLGGGDFLFMSAEFSKPKRIQGAFVSDGEIKKITEYIRKHNKNYVPLENSSVDTESENNKHIDLFDSYQDNGEEDELLLEVIELIRQAQKASASLLQRKLKIGYARAARILDILEDKGMIGPSNGAKPRDVYLDPNNNEE